MLPSSCAGAEKAAQGADAIGEYLAALSLAASNSFADAPALVKRLNSSVLDPTLSAGACAAQCQLFMTVTAAVVAEECSTFFCLDYTASFTESGLSAQLRTLTLGMLATCRWRWERGQSLQSGIQLSNCRVREAC